MRDFKTITKVHKSTSVETLLIWSKKAREPQLKKIEEGLHRLAAELQAVELV